MIDLGFAKAKRKDNNEWTMGYVFKHEKFNGGKDSQYFLLKTGTNEDGLPAMENPMEGHQVWEKTICFYTTANSRLTGDKIFQGDKLAEMKNYDLAEYGEPFVIWDEEQFTFFVKFKPKGVTFLLSDCLDCKIIGNIYDDFNLSKRELKAKKKAKA